MQHFTFYDRLISLSKRSWRFFRAAARVRISSPFKGWIQFHYGYATLHISLHPSVDTWVVFYSLAIVDNAAKNTDIQIFKSPLSLFKKKNQNSCKTSPQWINYQKVKDEIRSSTVLSCRRAGGKGKDGWHSPCVILLVAPPKILCPRWVPHSLHLHPGLVGMKGAWLSTLGQETPFPPTPSSHGWFRNQSDGAAFKLESWSWGFLSPRIDSS